MSTSTSLGVGAAPMGPSGIVMDTSKAMATLGFSPSQTFESTAMSEINRNFMFKMHQLQQMTDSKVHISIFYVDQKISPVFTFVLHVHSFHFYPHCTVCYTVGHFRNIERVSDWWLQCSPAWNSYIGFKCDICNKNLNLRIYLIIVPYQLLEKCKHIEHSVCR